jgi:DNA recombination protein RmuC
VNDFAAALSAEFADLRSVVLAHPAAAVLVSVLLVALAGLLLRARAERAAIERRQAELETAFDAERDARAEAERRSAAEAVVAARVPDLEREIAEARADTVRSRDERAEAERRLATIAERLARTEETAAELRTRLTKAEDLAREAAGRLETLRADKAAVDEALAARSADLDRLGERAADLDARLAAAEADRTALARSRGELETRLARLGETLEQERRQADEKLKLLEDARGRMSAEFKVLAEEVMNRHGEAFTKQNKEQVGAILEPLRSKLTEFQQGLANAQTETVKERATLAEQIRGLAEVSGRMSTETRALTRALKGRSQTQGAWGEMVLARILEQSGLREGEEYVTQESHASEDGGRLRPDVIVNLPEGRRIVVDSKVSLTAFEEYVNAEDETLRTAALRRHVASLEAHVRELGDKAYQTSVAGTDLDYVIMFVPIEGAFAAALSENPGLTADAVGRNVAIATPTTLMAALRTIASVWQVDRRNRNAEEIARRAGLLYEKFAGFVEDLQKIGGRIDDSRVAFDRAMGKLTTGGGNLVRQVELLKSLGAKTAKSLPADLVEAADTQPLLTLVAGEADAASAAETSPNGSAAAPH